MGSQRLRTAQPGSGTLCSEPPANHQHERQPLTLDGNVWIVADARVDGRPDLLSKLVPGERSLLAGKPDVELILRAYLKWGEACLEQLIGDFSFAIWDKSKRSLFCARDHFGIKLFYYAKAGNCLIFSNTLNCIRQHPGVPGTLNDLAIADFLLFDWNQDLGTTSFKHIQRIPPAHYLLVGPDVPTPRRYWKISCEPVRYRRNQDYIDRCKELLDLAVADRVRTDQVGVRMSGGLDSTLVAALAKRTLSRDPSSSLRAYTVVYDRIIPDEEREYSQIAADYIGIPIHYLVADDHLPYTGPQFRWPEPMHEPQQAGVIFALPGNAKILPGGTFRVWR